jgi:hypothetical protein
MERKADLQASSMAAVRTHVMSINAINPATVRIPGASEYKWGEKGDGTYSRK